MPGKPRSARLTHVLDKCVAPGDLRTLPVRFAAYIDIWKLGWGTAYLDPGLPEKLGLLDRHDVRACAGGTLLEAAWVQGRAADYLAWCSETGFSGFSQATDLAEYVMEIGGVDYRTAYLLVGKRCGGPAGRDCGAWT